MKLLLPVLLLLSFSALSQTKGTAKLYAFKEPVSGGKSPGSGIEENGNAPAPVAEVSTSFNYFIYLQSASRAYPSEMWLDGKPYSVRMETVTTPVERDNGTSPLEKKKKLLVPKTSEKVILLSPVPAIESKLSATARTLAAKNELVVVYKQNGKSYYKTVKAVTVLDAAPMQ